MDNETFEDIADNVTGDVPSPDVTVTVPTTHHVPRIFLQTPAAQGIAGVFAFAAMIITCWQVKICDAYNISGSCYFMLP
jgi:hypothetical protein